MNRKGQQEMVGFVLIIAVVMVALVIFLIFSLRGGSSEISSVSANNMLESVMRKTTECATNFVPNYDSYEDLFKSCYEGENCQNLGKNSCDYLEESLKDVMDELIRSEATIEAYSVYFFAKETPQEEISIVSGGECSGRTINYAQKSIISGSESLSVRIELCFA